MCVCVCVWKCMYVFFPIILHQAHPACSDYDDDDHVFFHTLDTLRVQSSGALAFGFLRQIVTGCDFEVLLDTSKRSARLHFDLQAWGDQVRKLRGPRHEDNCFRMPPMLSVLTANYSKPTRTSSLRVPCAKSNDSLTFSYSFHAVRRTLPIKSAVYFKSPISQWLLCFPIIILQSNADF